MSTVKQAPRFSSGQGESWAREFYGLTARAEELPSERDQNFCLTTSEGIKYVLKIANAAEDRSILDLQNRAMLHLAQARQPPLCSRIIPNANGDLLSQVRDSAGVPHFLRLVTYLDGVPLGRVRPQSPELLFDLGCFTARLVRGLADFSHPAARRLLIWDMQKGPETVAADKCYISDPGRRALVASFLRRLEGGVRSNIGSLEKSVIHNDGNDYNVIVTRPDPGPGSFGRRTIVGFIDFGDMVYSYTLAELAVACAYIMLEKGDPLAAAAAAVAGYHSVLPLKENEIELLYHLICLRLTMSAAICAYQTHLKPDNPYLAISNRFVWALLEELRNVHPDFACCLFRRACRLDPCPESAPVSKWIEDHQDEFAPVTGFSLKSVPKTVFDLSAGSLLIENPAAIAETKGLSDLLFGEMEKDGTSVGVGTYGEARLLYASPNFKPAGRPLAEGRTVHLGIDIFMEPGSPVFAALDGVVHSFRNNAVRLDYGPTIILEHQVEERRLKFYTLYGHLSSGSLNGLERGKPVRKGERIAKIGPYPENGDWPPHLHFQIILNMLGGEGDFPGVAKAGEKEVWLSLCPDPNLVLGIPGLEPPAGPLDQEKILELRKIHIGKSLRFSYKKPLKIIRGFKQFLYDDAGRAYLDAVNNVPHVGHSHPRVVRAIRRQLAVLNTNTRYLHENLVRYAQRLTATLPPPLRVCYFVNSGSEANDLALRLARNFTKQRDMIVLDGAYHGHLTSLIEISPYKFDGPGGSGRPPFTHKVVMPDLYRGPYRTGDPDAGAKYAGHVRDAIERIRREGRGTAGFICEPLLSCGGQIVLPDDFLREAYRHVREAKGVCIADEVQVGFGRVGTHFWGFQTQGVVPDIVSMGKPIGNGFPLAAVVTTPEISEAFATGMEYFNTYGGNPVACAAGTAVLDVMEVEKLQENALRVGARLREGLKALMTKYPLIGDVRGLGLFLGVELVLNRDSRAPAALQAAYIVERMREEGILLSTDGPDRNVLKIKPPLCFTAADADLLVAALDKVLVEDPVRID